MKDKLRDHYRKLRKTLGGSRRSIAEHAANQFLMNWILSLENPTLILSFASFESEINIWPFNTFLEKQGQLVLPKLEKESIKLYHVTSKDKDLKMNRFKIWEPLPEQCVPIDPEQLSAIVVPALAFDRQYHRLGYGHGFYDRFLKKVPDYIPLAGVGFQEQLSEKPLPVTPMDHPLTHLFLF